MNLGKLLGTGKSFISGGKPAAYREDKRFYLPQFVSPKNPFANSVPPPAPVQPPELPVAKAVTPGAKATPRWNKTEKIAVPAVQGATARATTWVSKLNPAAIFSHGPAAASDNPVPMQAEFTLEKVKVVHNDLTDAEVEVVPMKSRPARESAGSEAGKRSWAELGERIMKATAL
jgi:hypothetical protein